MESTKNSLFFWSVVKSWHHQMWGRHHWKVTHRSWWIICIFEAWSEPCVKPPQGEYELLNIICMDSNFSSASYHVRYRAKCTKNGNQRCLHRILKGPNGLGLNQSLQRSSRGWKPLQQAKDSSLKTASSLPMWHPFRELCKLNHGHTFCRKQMIGQDITWKEQ